ncbi:MAG: FkbM family methyltransferase [Bacteroidota bacterium]
MIRSGAGALIYKKGHSDGAVTDLLHQYVRPGMTVLDIGAHIGEFTIVAGHLVGADGRVIAFEPNAALVEVVRDNVRLNGLAHVHVEPVALADTDGDVVLEVHSEPSISALLEEGMEQRPRTMTARVSAITLDAYCSAHQVTPHLIKIDVEGAELSVLRGARRLLEQPSEVAPMLIVECSDQNYKRFGHTGQELFGMLQDLGYHTGQWLDGHFVEEALDVVPRTINVIATKSLSALRRSGSPQQ